MSGILLIDKSPGFTSHDAVARTRRLAGTRKVGHAGTLDPMATGLLVLGVNSSTRLLTFVVGLDKEYFATVRLGAATSTDDAEGELLPSEGTSAVADIAPEALERAFAAQRGTIEQVPSSVSAIKIDGQRAYARVRAGEEVVLKSRTVTIAELELLGDPRPAAAPDGADASGGAGPFVDVDIRVVCSSGTYIRAIARDVGELLGVGGHLTALRRTRIGPFGIDDAHTLDELAAITDAGDPLPLRTPAAVARQLFPVLEVDHAQATALGHGQRIEATLDAGAPAPTASGPIAAITTDGRLLGLVEVHGGRAKSIVNFPPDEYLPQDDQPQEDAPQDDQGDQGGPS